MTARVAALYVQPRGIYSGRPDVETWDAERDARLYCGPWSVVAHPPCNRWCRNAAMNESLYGLRRGDDGGCFAAALEAVRAFGGVLEHPAWSAAWPAHGLQRPPARGWQRSLGDPGWVCEVAQSAYGHRAQKLTWLYYVGSASPPPLDWRQPKGTAVVGYMARRGDGSTYHAGRPRLSKRAGASTPPAFAELLLDLARSSRQEAQGAQTDQPRWRAV
jgi:hypothetical protein